jgi:hypothetical protein
MAVVSRIKCFCVQIGAWMDANIVADGCRFYRLRMESGETAVLNLMIL